MNKASGRALKERGGSKKNRSSAKTATSVHEQKSAIAGPLKLSRRALKLLNVNRPIFIRLSLLFWALLMLSSGLTEQAQYASLSEATKEAVSIIGGHGERTLTAIGILLSSVMTGSLTSVLSETQLIGRIALYGLLWLVVVWLMRHLVAGAKVGLRDGLYNGGAPVVPSILIGLVGVVQLLPLALTVTLFSALSATGALNQGLIAGLMVIASLALTVVTVYWLSSTLFALIVATIPGTYPGAALRSARTVIKGRRLTVFLRLLWLSGAILLASALITLPMVVLDATLGLMNAFVFIAVWQLLGVATALFGSVYLYLLYREVIDERAD